ncbi:MAG: hypothetical protein HRT47_07790 [Candidatus Caenarcaniphilales bacterium]|nr:hypothetical protein [Candidatus Caenarcaniphilales bacterium]
MLLDTTKNTRTKTEQTLGNNKNIASQDVQNFSLLNPETEIAMSERNLRKEGFYYAQPLSQKIESLLVISSPTSGILQSADNSLSIELQKKIHPLDGNKSPIWVIQRRDKAAFLKIIDKRGFSQTQRMDPKTEIGVYRKSLQRARIPNSQKVTELINERLKNETSDQVILDTKLSKEGKEDPLHLSKKLPGHCSQIAHWTFKQEDQEKFERLIEELVELKESERFIKTEKEFGINTRYLKEEKFNTDLVNRVPKFINDYSGYLELSEESYTPLTKKQGQEFSLWTTPKEYLQDINNFVKNKKLQISKENTQKQTPRKKTVKDTFIINNENNLRKLFKEHNIEAFPYHQKILTRSINNISDDKAELRFINPENKKLEVIEFTIKQSKNSNKYITNIQNLDKIILFLKSNSQQYSPEQELQVTIRAFKEAKISNYKNSYELIMNSLIQESDHNAYIKYIDPQTKETEYIDLRKKVNSRSGNIWTIKMEDLGRLNNFINAQNTSIYKELDPDKDIGLTKHYLEQARIPGFTNLEKAIQEYIIEEDDKNANLFFNDKELEPIHLEKKVTKSSHRSIVWSFKREDLNRFLAFLKDKEMISAQMISRDKLEKIDSSKEIGIYRRTLLKEKFNNAHLIPELVLNNLVQRSESEAILRSKSQNFSDITLLKKVPEKGGGQIPVWSFKRDDLQSFELFLKENNLNQFPLVDFEKELPINVNALKKENFENFSTLPKYLNDAIDITDEDNGFIEFDDTQGNKTKINFQRKLLPPSLIPVWSINKTDINNLKAYCLTSLQQKTLLPNIELLERLENIKKHEILDIPTAASKEERIASLFLQKHGLIEDIKIGENFQIPLLKRFKGDFLIKMGHQDKILLEYHPKIWDKKRLSKLISEDKDEALGNLTLQKVYASLIDKTPFTSTKLEEYRIKLIDKLLDDMKIFYKQDSKFLEELKLTFINLENNFDNFYESNKKNIDDIFSRDLKYPSPATKSGTKEYFKQIDFYDLQRLLLIDQMNKQEALKVKNIPQKYIRIENMNELNHLVLPRFKPSTTLSQKLNLQMLKSQHLAKYVLATVNKRNLDKFIDNYNEVVERTNKFDAKVSATS